MQVGAWVSTIRLLLIVEIYGTLNQPCVAGKSVISFSLSPRERSQDPMNTIDMPWPAHSGQSAVEVKHW